MDDVTLCPCHEEPMFWHRDPRYTAGGRWECRIENRERSRQWHAANPEKHKEWRASNLDRRRESARRWGEKLWADFFDHYGHACTCCGEDEPMFLTVEHLNGRDQERRSYNSRLELARLRREGWPDDVTVRCINCNQGRWRNGGVCPHQTSL